MNSWCESCARKNCCYTMEIRPKCYLPTTNTAHGTPETYLAKSLRYSRESHEIAEQTEPQTERLEQFRVGLEYHTDTTHFGKTKGESIATNKVEDEPQTQLTARCLNCNNAKACKEKHWEGCIYEPKDEKTCETCRHWKYIAHEWQCEACKCQGYEQKDEPNLSEYPTTTEDCSTDVWDYKGNGKWDKSDCPWK